jgi:hypothetical protein
LGRGVLVDGDFSISVSQAKAWPQKSPPEGGLFHDYLAAIIRAPVRAA